MSTIITELEKNITTLKNLVDSTCLSTCNDCVGFKKCIKDLDHELSFENFGQNRLLFQFISHFEERSCICTRYDGCNGCSPFWTIFKKIEFPEKFPEVSLIEESSITQHLATTKALNIIMKDNKKIENVDICPSEKDLSLIESHNTDIETRVIKPIRMLGDYKNEDARGDKFGRNEIQDPAFIKLTELHQIAIKRTNFWRDYLKYKISFDVYNAVVDSDSDSD